MRKAKQNGNTAMGKRTRSGRILTFLVILLLGVVLCQVSTAQRSSRGKKSAPTTSIPEEDRPWTGTAWLTGIVLTAGAVFVGIKNAKRTHFD